MKSSVSKGTNPMMMMTTTKATVVATLLLLALGGARAQDPVIWVNVKGTRFASLDGTDPRDVTGVCEEDPIGKPIPAGWSLAPRDTETLLAIRLFRFGTSAAVLADGSAWTTGPDQQHINQGGNALRVGRVDHYTVDYCHKRVLISQPGAPEDPPSVVKPDNISNFVSFNGTEYATLDDTAPDDVSNACQSHFFEMPDGWTVAEDSDASRLALTGVTFGTACLVTETGASYSVVVGNDCGADSLAVIDFPGYAPMYGVQFCNKRVLIQRDAQTPSPDTMIVSTRQNRVYAQGNEFATLDSATPNTGWPPVQGCQVSPLRVPDGWSLAMPSTAGVNDVVANNDWSTSCVVLGDGSGLVASANGYACGVASQLVNHGDFYGVDSCQKRILITRPVLDEYDVPMKILLLTPKADADAVPTYGVAHTMLQALGTPFDVHETGDEQGYARANTPLPLQDDVTGAPRYLGVVKVSNSLSTAQGATLTAQQVTALAEYAMRFRVRVVSLYTYPSSVPGIAAPTYNYGSIEHTLVFDAGVSQDLADTVPLDAEFPRVPGQGFGYPGFSDGSADADLTPVLRYNTRDAGAPMAAVIRARRDGSETRTEEMHFFFDGNTLHAEGPALSNMWIKWLSRGAFIGRRRVMLSTQIDDIFLSTELFNVEEMRPARALERKYRASGDDIRFVVEWQREVRAKLPAGSTFRCELAFNGKGAYSIDYLNTDTIATYQQERDEFFWESHTWSHLDLTCPYSNCTGYGATTYDQAMFELGEDLNYARNYLFPAPESPETAATYSRSGVVTPRISGLFNPESLRALWDHGVRNVVGDNSRDELRPVGNPYHARMTTLSHNGFDGIMVIPRYPTRVYFDVSTPAELEAEHDYSFGPNGVFPYYAETQPTATIMDLEAKFVSALLLQYRHDPYMFHQANLRRFLGADDQLHTLHSLWTDAVLNSTMSFNRLPVLTLKQDDLASEYAARMQRDACDVQGTMHVRNGVAQSIELVSGSGAGCTAVLTGVDVVQGAVPDATEEQYGIDHSVYVPLSGTQSRVVPLATPITMLDSICASNEDCDDNNQCTQDVCTPFVGCDNSTPASPLPLGCGGFCDSIVCDDNNACTVDTCDDVLGCVFTPADELSCDDGNVCNGAETCVNGACVLGTPLVCNDDNACTADTCDNVFGCVFSADDTLVCEDGLACNGVETCVSGVCEAGLPLVCDDANACTVDSCNNSTGCVFTADDSLVCDDGDVCNGREQCSSGVCIEAMAAPVCEDSRACVESECDALLGCVLSVSLNVTCDQPLFNCTEIVCDDGNDCTFDECDDRVGCLFHADNTLSCDDGDACNGVETCSAGVCMPGLDLVCEDGNACTVDVCDSVLGCVFTANDTLSCDDGDVCNGEEVCANGACMLGVALVCDDGNDCTTNECDAVLGCLFRNDDSLSCSDGNACNGDETCVSGACVAGTPMVCDDSNVCTTDSCDSVTGTCVFAIDDSATCSDGNVCNGEETCMGGVCFAGAAPDCDDGNPCTVDACDVFLGCSHTPSDALSCDDGDVCNGVETCVAGACVRTAALDCNDGFDCTTDTCDAVTGCAHTACVAPFPAGSSSCADVDCDDNNECTTDTCDAVKGCHHEPVTCDDGNQCTVDTCNPATGCVFTNDDALTCDDGDLCTVGDSCLDGLCVANAKDCSAIQDSNVCTEPTCNATTGACELSPVEAACDDGNMCTQGDQCVAGVCMAGVDNSESMCDDSNACTIDTCDAVLGCRYSTRVCADDDQCTMDSCHPTLGCIHSTVVECGGACDDGYQLAQRDSCCMSLNADDTDDKQINTHNRIVRADGVPAEQCKGTLAEVWRNGAWEPLRVGLFYVQDDKVMQAPLTATERASGLATTLDGAWIRIYIACNGETTPRCLRFRASSVCSSRPVCTALPSVEPARCKVTFVVDTDAATAGTMHVRDIEILTNVPVNGFQLQWHFPGQQHITGAFGDVRATQVQQRASLTGGVVPGNTPFRVGGFIALTDGSMVQQMPAATSMTLNGVECTGIALPVGEDDNDASKPRANGSLGAGAVVGIALVCVAVVAVIAGVSVYQLNRRSREEGQVAAAAAAARNSLGADSIGSGVTESRSRAASVQAIDQISSV